MPDDSPPNSPNNRFDLPDQGSDPVEWDASKRAFVPKSGGGEGTEAQPAEPGRDQRRFYVGAGSVGQAPPARQGGGATVAPPPTPPPSGRAPTKTPVPAPMPRPQPKPARRWPRLRRPKARWIVLLCVLLPILLLIGGFIYADMKFREVKRVPVGSLLAGSSKGENILIVGSDTRENADPNAPDAGAILGDASNRAPGGQRSDTIMVLRLEGSTSKILSIPRDLILPIAETGKKDRVNSAYNADLGGGPARLLQTVQQSLGIPINRYMEVDFVTFAGLVDAVGGITINFPYPAFDTNTGLDVKQAGAVHLDGTQALAYVRSRHYTEIKEDGKPHEDPTADLGRVQRQQQFLSAVMGKIGSSHNPVTLLKVGGQVADGIRVDDKLGLWDAMKLAWDLKGITPEGVPLPVGVNSDNATLHLQEPAASEVIAQFQ